MDIEGQLAVFTTIDLFVNQISRHALLPTYRTYPLLSKVEDRVFHHMLTLAEVQDIWVMHSLLCQPECGVSLSANLEIKINVFCYTQAQYTMVAHKPELCNSTPILRQGERETHNSHLSMTMIRSCQFEESRLLFLAVLYVPQIDHWAATHSCSGKNSQVPCSLWPLSLSFWKFFLGH